jgi:hypothetical protein
MLKRRGPSRSPLRHPRCVMVVEDRKYTCLGPCSPGSSSLKHSKNRRPPGFRSVGSLVVRLK